MSTFCIWVSDIAEIWDNLFFLKESILAISVFRIFAGILMAIEAVQWGFYFYKLISAEGYFSLTVFKKYVQPVRFSLLSYLPENNWSITILIALQFAAAVLLIFGLYANFAAFLCFVATVSIHNRNAFVLDSGDTVRRYFCLFLIFAPCGYQLSLTNYFIDVALKGWPWPMRLIQFFIANIYFKNVLFKLSGNTWRHGTATGNIFKVCVWSRFTQLPFMEKRWYSKLTTYGTLCIEAALCSLIWIDSFRPWLIPAGIIFHLGIWLFLRIGFFQLTMIAGLLSFVTSAEYLHFFKWIGIY